MMRMTPKEFLESGFLEEYTMGLLSDDKAREVREFIEKHPSVKTVYDEHQRAIKEMAEAHAIAPPAGIKGAVMSAIQPEVTPTMLPPKIKPSYGSWILATLVGALAIYSFAMWKSTVRELNHQKSEFALLQNDCEHAKKESAVANNLIAFYQNPNTKSTILTGNGIAEEFNMIARYNSAREEVALDVLTPAQIPANKVLCLWGDKNGKMILIAKLDQSSKAQMVKYDKDMESLNVTIEEMADVIDHPDVSQLIASVAIG